MTSLVAQTVRSLPAVQETCVRSLGWEDPLEKEMTTHSSILAWKIPWTEEPSRLQSMGSQRVGHDSVTNTFIISYIIKCIHTNMNDKFQKIQIKTRSLLGVCPEMKD